MKQYQQDFDCAEDALSELITILKSNLFNGFLTYSGLKINLRLYEDFITELFKNLTLSRQVVDIRLLNFIHNIIIPIYLEIKELTNLEKSLSFKLKVITILKKLDTAKNDYYTFCPEDINKKVVNSAAYYNSRLQELKN